ncbi:MAG: (2Fe-2S)-binding protein [Acidobacteriota bacterium]|nr:(2Fe-2S)-binding protein [Blastocatellia bacterium]MDW8413482.1 (2Fe-2S)-binding protein [Acidobacteriota bacterium]
MVRVKINGHEHVLQTEPLARLLDVLRETLGFTGTKEGCGEGECGACSVIIDGELVNSCLIPICQVDGCEILTVEGLAVDGELSLLQQCFVEYGATQCGICIPGMLMAAKALLDSNSCPTRNEIRAAIAGNLCRCTGYMKIVDAIEAAVAAKLEVK